MLIASPTESLHPTEGTGPQTTVPSMGRPRNVERVGLRTPPVHKRRQSGGVHHRQTADDELSKPQESRMLYERCIPLIPCQGVVCADLERGQSL
jgi:hypothetical protein